MGISFGNVLPDTLLERCCIMFAASHAARKATIRGSLIYGAEKPERGERWFLT
jgi:hypothetical protein